MGKLSGQSEGHSAPTDAASDASSADVSVSPTVAAPVQRVLESRPHLPTVDMPANSDSLDLQSIGKAASGAQRMSDGVIHRHPTTPPLSVGAGNMPTVTGQRSGGKGRLSRFGSAIQRTGQTIVGRMSMGTSSWTATPGDYNHEQTSPVWRAVAPQASDTPASDFQETLHWPSRRAVPTKNSESGASNTQKIRRKVSSAGPPSTKPSSRAVVRRTPTSKVGTAATTTRDKPIRRAKPTARAAATVIRRRPSVEAMPKLRRRLEKAIRPTIGKSIAQRTGKPMASPERWRPQEMGASQDTQAGPPSMESMLDAPIAESRSLNLKPVAQRQTATPGVSQTPTAEVQRSTAEAIHTPATSPSVTPEKAQPTPPARRTTSDSPEPAAKTSTKSILSRGKKTSEPSISRQADNVETPIVTTSEPKVQRISEVSKADVSGTIIDVPSPSPEASDSPVETTSSSTQMNPAKRLLGGAKDLVFRMSSPEASRDFPAPTPGSESAVPISAVSNSRPTPVQRDVSPDNNVTTTDPVGTGKAEPVPAGEPAPKLQRPSRIRNMVSRSVDKVTRKTSPRSPDMVLRQERVSPSQTPELGAPTPLAASSTPTQAPGGQPTSSSSANTKSPRNVMRKIRHSITKAASPSASRKPKSVSTVSESRLETVAQRRPSQANSTQPGSSTTTAAQSQPSAGYSNSANAPRVKRSGGFMSKARNLVLRKSNTAGGVIERSTDATVAPEPASNTVSPLASNATPKKANDHAKPIRRKTLSNTPQKVPSAPASASVSQATVQRKATSSLPTGEPMAHSSPSDNGQVGVHTQPNQSQRTRTNGTKPVAINRPAPQMQAKPDTSSPIRRVAKKIMPAPSTTADRNGSLETSGASVQRSMEMPELTHSNRPVPNMQPADMTPPSLASNPVRHAAPTPASLPRPSLRGIDRKMANTSSANAKPQAETPKLCAAKPVVHRLAAPLSTPSVQAANDATSSSSTNTGSFGTSGSQRHKAQRKTGAKSSTKGNNDQKIQRDIEGVVEPSIGAISSPIGTSISESPYVTINDLDDRLAKITGPDKFSGEDVDYLSSKVYQYIKRKLRMERERSGNPGFALWR